MRFYTLLITIFFSYLIFHAGSLSAQSHATALQTQLMVKGFNCSKAVAHRAMRCRGSVSFYPKSLNIYIPNGFNASSKATLSLHFHGFNLYGDGAKAEALHFDIKSGNGDYGKMLVDSKSNAIVIIPESDGKVITYKQHFKNDASIFSFIEKSAELVGLSNPDMKISSHSGSDSIMDLIAGACLRAIGSLEKAVCLDVRALGLFDSHYGERANLYAWLYRQIINNPDFLFFNSYVKNGSTQKRNVDLEVEMTKLKLNAKQIYFKSVETNHMSIMRDGGLSDFWAD